VKYKIIHNKDTERAPRWSDLEPSPRPLAPTSTFVSTTSRRSRPSRPHLSHRIFFYRS